VRRSGQYLIHHKEDVMRTKSLTLTVGFWSLMAAAVGLSASNSFAAGAQRVDVIDNLPTGNQSDGLTTTANTVQRVDVIDRIGANGAVHAFTSGKMRVDVIDHLAPQRLGDSSTSETMSVGVLDRLLAVGSPLARVTTPEDKVTRVDVIDSLPPEAQWDSTNHAGPQVSRVDVIDSLASHGPVYPSTSGAMRVDVIERTRS
jgi:hypothetical protein